ncbi:MAG: PDZ domain-containing protein [Sphingobacteriales bacterium]|nr:MAG: PDZ domain-containing protein [Sphingobacteriales bacterium]
MKSRILPVVLTAAATSLVTLFAANQFPEVAHKLSPTYSSRQLPVNYVDYGDNSTTVRSAAPVDFQAAAEASVKAVVHIKTTTKPTTRVVRDPFMEMFGFDGNQIQRIPPQMGSGSGVVISPDGYIVTNNHVVAGADQVTVTFNDRYTSQAKVVATDPATDIAVIKVSDKDLSYMEFGNSDQVRLGQWVLAVGYPLTLNTTVTAGIVSAKARSIGINRTQSDRAIESFIQTDAAVNPGNSGGALVNTNGQLIGINSAIASPTGSYAGYSYAIPANIVKKVTQDLIQYGAVQRGYLGISYRDRATMTPEEQASLGIDRTEGVYVADVVTGSGASRSALRKGDFITAINSVPVRTEPEMLEQVARYKPGDNISVTYLRKGQTGQTSVQLQNADNNTSLVKAATAAGLVFGGKLRNLSAAEKQRFGVTAGVLVEKVGTGVLRQQTNMQDGFIITNVNDVPVGTVEALQKAILAAPRNTQLAGVYPGYSNRYYYGLADATADAGDGSN